MDNVTKQCVQCKKNFIITADEIALYNKLDMPQSKLCFDCLHQKHFAFWVWGKFRKGKSDLDGSSLITVMPEKSRFPLYTSKQWFSDEWDALTYGQEYDPDRSFFEQLKELQEKVPHPHQVGRNGINCDWCDDVWDSKNCYLSRSIANCEDSCFILRVVEAKDACDITYGIKVDKSYDSTYCFGVSQLKYSLNCHQCIDSAFLFDCRNVQNSFMCWNLRNKSYCWNNKQLTKDEYNKKLSEYDLGSWKVVSELYIKFEKILREEAIHKENFNLKVNYSTGNYIRSCNRCINTFYWENSENCYNCMRGLDSKDLINVTGNWKMELAGNNAHCVDGYFQKCNLWCSVCRFIEYCDQCDSCENCFGCVGLNKKNYCILNKQYTKEE
ncbi:MAG: hypothetical protein Q7R95_00005, partial [bacterium]|nr:hypothetical protein [bacterium]